MRGCGQWITAGRWAAVTALEVTATVLSSFTSSANACTDMSYSPCWRENVLETCAAEWSRPQKHLSMSCWASNLSQDKHKDLTMFLADSLQFSDHWGTLLQCYCVLLKIALLSLCTTNQALWENSVQWHYNKDPKRYKKEVAQIGFQNWVGSIASLAQKGQLLSSYYR